jgi:broad specificity phosphatase PhoE
MCEVVLIRPGATSYDEQHRVQGVLDIPLSERGQGEVSRMAHELAITLAGSRLAALYCGPCENVIRTAEVVGRTLGLRPKRIDELRNLDHGLWQGLQIDEIRRRNTRLFRQWIEDPATICPPQGETVASAMERIKTAFRPLIRRHHDEPIGLVVGEPLGRMVACYLKCEPRVQLPERRASSEFERIKIAPLLLGNGAAS